MEYLYQLNARGYDSIEQIGKGSFGVVFKARHAATGQEVAVKVMQDIGGNDYRRRQIISEIQIMRKLTAMPNNVYTTKLLDVITPDNSEEMTKLPYVMLVMNYIESDMVNIMESAEDLDLTESHVVTMMYNILCSLNFLHTANIMHRDIKPANILIDSQCVPVLCDFGLARTCIKSKVESQISNEHKETASGRKSIAEVLDSQRNRRQQRRRRLSNHVVSRWYRPPEIILLEKKYDAAVDIWSVGCIFAELLGCLQDKIKKQRPNQILFQGNSCYPLSPRNNNSSKVNHRHKDQMEQIIRKIGFPSQEDQSFLSQSETSEYL